MTDRLGETLDWLENWAERFEGPAHAKLMEALAAARAWHTLPSLVRQFAFDIVMVELGMDEQDMDDQADTTEKVNAWMEHWQSMLDALSDTAEPEAG